MARIRIRFKGTETTIPLADGETTVGRSNRCTVHLPDPGLAPVHFRIRRRPKGWQLKDDGSGLGTRVNGKPVFAKTLHHDDMIEAGHLRCRFLTEADAPAPVPPVAEPPARAPRERIDPPEPPKKRSRTGRVAGLGVGLLVLAAAAVFLFGGPGEDDARRLWRQAQEWREKAGGEAGVGADLEEAAALLRQLRDRHGRARIAATAMGALAEVETALDALHRLDEERRDIGAAVEAGREQAAFARIARLKIAAHPLVERRAADVEAELASRRDAADEQRFAAVAARAADLLQGRNHAGALRAWREFSTDDYTFAKRAEEQLRLLEKRIAGEYRAVLRLAGRGADLDARIGLLEASRDVFKGTRHAQDLEVRIAALRARRNLRTIVVLDRPRTPAETGKEPDAGEAPPPEEAGPYEEPEAVAALVKKRAYAEAASTLHGISRHPVARVRIEELTLLANLMADLQAAVRAKPAEFTNILLPHGVGRGDAVGADARFLEIAKDGETGTRYAWDALPAKSFVRLFRLAGFLQPPRLATALFFDEEMVPHEAERAYLAFYRSEQTPETFARILARRRGIEPPKGGFELFRGRIVTGPEKERILLLERIEKLGRKARSTVDKRRREAWAELETLGEPAVETLTLALKDRQRAVAEELRKSSAFSAQRYAARLGPALREARENALRFILDAQRYPYPNKSDAAQKEAERLVDEVRTLYENPYPLLLAKSDKAEALDRELKELDALTARADPLAEPVYETVVAAVVRKLDPAMVALDGRDGRRIEYNVSVRAYNKTVPTSADDEERANVAAVNEYRWMMGLRAVKIDERLVRAARKHSIEMRQLEYFAHDSPTPELRSPGLRARREGYPGGVAENIARGASTGGGAFWQWFRSSGHHRNMLNPGHTELGCGAFAHHWWTQKFGRATGRGLNPPKVPRDPDPPGESGNGKPAPAGTGS